MASILDRIDGPADVKKLTGAELEELAQDIREELINLLKSQKNYGKYFRSY